MIKVVLGVVLILALLCATFMVFTVCRLKTPEERDMDDEGQIQFLHEYNLKKCKK